MRIGEVGHRAGVSAKTIRYYEDIGLLPEPERADNGYREYDDGVVERLAFIRDAQASGLSLTEIGSILEERDRGERTCHHVLELLEHHLEDIDRQIRQLRKMRTVLARMTEHARSLDPAACVDPNRCQTIMPDAGASPATRTAGARIHGSPAAAGRHG